ncbi:uncharacterized protein F5147DRAFT_657706 [Suillus discolor]|uniref:Uncharacterized protein n=1 Tax=Suillus discolor TaxID=1912936 RepID=A0A9P7EWM7_9AGAM|nr:uncharacterized protein F5147DRAFT_657706 [Suillus discolor]KAG2092294.1 hypothetical protein F5147DRAFT_657706 [Suillus discolor]
MTFRKVRFLTPEQPYLGDIASTCSTYSSHASEDGLVALGRASDKGLIDWWGSYIPLELWTPPALLRKPRMKGVVGLENYLKFKKYDLTQEFPADHEKMDDLFAQRDQVYELCFNGHFDKIGSMLAGSFLTQQMVQDMYAMESRQTFRNVAQTPQVTLPGGECSTYAETAPRTRYDDSYDCGWDDPSSAESVEDPYDCGWELSADTQSIVQSAELPDAYDCGWDCPMDDQGIPQSCGSAEDAYDCGWDHPMDDQAILQLGESAEDAHDCGWDHPMDDQAILQSSEPAADAYDCGWDHPMDDQGVQQSGESAANVDRSVEDPYDCGWDNPMNVTEASSNVTEEYVGIDASQDGGSAGDDPYDCGWDAPEVSRPTATGSNTVDEFASSEHWPSLLEDNETNVFEHAEHSMRSVIRILHDIRPDNIHHNANSIATTAGHVLDPMLTPTSFGTQGSIGAHTEARNRVAELGEDIATVHHLLNVHRRIMTQLDVMIANCAK